MTAQGMPKPAPEIAAFLAAGAANPLPSYPDLGAVDGRRQYRSTTAANWGPVTEHTGLTVTDAEIAGVPVRVYRPAPGPLPVVVYFHGGGWVIGDLDTHDGLCRDLAVESRAVVLAVDYRLAPEHPFPAAADDACAVLKAVLEETSALVIDPTRVVVAGDSAGGNLVAVAAQWAVAHGHLIAGQVLAYPIADTRTDTASYESYASGFGLTQDVMRWFIDAYLPEGTDRDDPRAAPLRAPDLLGLAPALVITCELDVLHDEGVAYAEALRAAEVAVEEVDVPGMVHGALLMPAVTPAAVEMRERVVEFLGEVWS